MTKAPMKEGFETLPPPPPLSGANAQPVHAQQNRPQQQGVHQVAQGNNNHAPPPRRKAGMFTMIRMCVVWSS
jgi:hypothetical protein